MKNAEYTGDIGLDGGFHETFTRSELKNRSMLQLELRMNRGFIRRTGMSVKAGKKNIDIREANVRDMVVWFEKSLRDWIKENK